MKKCIYVITITISILFLSCTFWLLPETDANYENNYIPNVNAGEDRLVATGVLINFYGIASDPDGGTIQS